MLMRAGRRRSAPLVLAATAALVAACAADPGEPTASPSGSTSTAAPPQAPLARVNPLIVDGFDVRVEENLDRQHLVYVHLPVIPNASALTDELRQRVGERVERFVTETDGSDEAPYPELQVTADLVGTSPALVGVRVHTRETADDTTFDGMTWTTWYDFGTGAVRPSQDLLAEGAETALVERVRDAATADPSIDPERLEEQLAGEREAFGSLAFTPDGRLWVEFSRAVVSTSEAPTALAVDDTDLLSPFGEAAKEAALSPTSPASGATPTDPPLITDATGAPGAVRTQEPGDVDCAEEKCLALTFDDGPVDGTGDLLDVLEERGVHATFFVVGTNARAHPDILQRMVEEGHVIGNHTLDHPQLTRLDAAGVEREIVQTNQIVADATGVTPTLLRPPYGATGPTVADVATSLGMAQVNWDVDPLDWQDRVSETVRERVLGAAHRGAIVLSHDIHETTRDAYAAIVDQLLADGYTLVTVPELLGGSPTPGQLYFNG